MYQTAITPAAKKQLDQLGEQQKNYVLKQLFIVAASPEPQNAALVKPMDDGSFTIRTGSNSSMVCKIDNQKSTITVLALSVVPPVDEHVQQPDTSRTLLNRSVVAEPRVLFDAVDEPDRFSPGLIVNLLRPFALAFAGAAKPRPKSQNSLAVSYLALRKFIGICGIVLPIILIVLPAARPTKFHGFEPSISDYYYTYKGDIFTMVLCILGAFLFTYHGYNKMERLITFFAGLCALLVAFVPTAYMGINPAFSVHEIPAPISAYLGGKVHLTCAAIFFVLISILSLVYFPKSNMKVQKIVGGARTQKAKRNLVYRGCGLFMLGCVVALGAMFFIPGLKEHFGNFPVIFLLEALAVLAFGISWLVKGGQFFTDENQLTVVQAPPQQPPATALP